MKDVIRMFQERMGEIDSYFQFLETIATPQAKVILKDGTTYEVDFHLNQILRANGFLLLYNLTESSISQAIEVIHNDILQKGVEYDALNRLVKKEIFNHVRKNVKVDDFINDIQNIVVDIVKFHPQSREIFSGNVDAREIKNLSGKYGFSCETDAQKTKNGEKLMVVKNHRNDLAHGFVSFQECGKNYTIEDMLQIKEEVINYIKGILENIENYLREEKYKK
ncbi:MAG: hypothetical protein EAZ14_01190 [Runella slithyformis]|jgi:hypothetical protein|nr:MAG: hypothetical protein EAZ46_02605 [Runella sp.]TAG19082.1 MAG: hypothetical protein EAZ38_13305 [Cytophagales bacterium]TAG38372.1 MAG: hypothetical protein EAZ32_12685 [Cytophagia bacterium]TAG79938.1 MAG: hypothetical protein EAZ22_10610 [Cytophagales bacterium]TAH15947.1 MAG: hypothetical protein EAZ14_01190 [Runella slithyformis]